MTSSFGETMDEHNRGRSEVQVHAARLLRTAKAVLPRDFHEHPQDFHCDWHDLVVAVEAAEGAGIGSKSSTRQVSQAQLDHDADLTDLAYENETLRRDRDEWRNCAKYAVILFLVSSFAAACAISALILGGGQ